ncbi:MAG: response regulator transcription factor [Acidobacteria bacterium]|nr:response regulator transcription factor [Acidobacteriota bacterium]
MRVLIVDDEPIARSILRELLDEIPSVSVAGQASSAAEALSLMPRLAPDLLLLDIHMPGVDGVAFARSLRGPHAPLVIYVTAHDTHALAAFDSGAVDYLLKPVRIERLSAAIAKAQAQFSGRNLKPAPAPAETPRRIAARAGGEIHLLDPADVILFRAAPGGAMVLTTSGKYALDSTLKSIEEKYPPPRFRRIHRAVIINTNHLRAITPLSSKRFLLRLSGGIETAVSKRMAGAIREATRW